ncbi:hypothetical protein E3E36_09690 [Thermococcus sp. M36]|uniref:hypothetical protein n=1 Tax=Thermococcus sp. M36 TaxID=1638261 RepID=UPI001439AE26|nr:hypothetical protein [Thermococcus sp. M36]NJE06410.1 hypothetical protein [Thermococcus sp. M36]
MEMNVIDIFRKEYLPGSTISIIYDAYSSAWRIPIILLRHALENGHVGIVSNYSGPLRLFSRKASTVGLDVEDALAGNRLAIIDLFGTRYGSRESLPNVFYLDKVEPETLNPKIDRIYTGQLKGMIAGRPVLRLVYTLDGVSLLLGEDNTLKLLNQTLASKNDQLPESILVLALNKDVVSKRFVAWVAGISDYVILAKSWTEETGLKEALYVISAPYEEFEPEMYSFHVTKARGMEKLKVKKISP